MPTPPVNLSTLADQVLLQYYSPPAVLVNEDGDVIYINGRVGSYLELSSGKASLNIFALAKTELRQELGAVFSRVVRQREAAQVKGIRLKGAKGYLTLEITVRPLEHPDELKGLLLVVFEERARPPRSRRSPEAAQGEKDRIMELEAELEQAHQELHSNREEMQAAKNELKSINEEFQATMEELQSTNEELTTSREEMQSMNEELHTVNMEQLDRLEKLTQVNSDMASLLSISDVSAVLLDGKFHVRLFTPGATKLFRLQEGDVGRPLTDLSSSLVYPELHDDVRLVVKSLASIEKEVASSDGGSFLVRILPYRNPSGTIDGVMVTFSDISRSRSQEGERQASEVMLRALVETVPALIISLSREGALLEFNRAVEKFLGRTRVEVLGRDFCTLFVPETDRAQVRADIERVLTGTTGQRFETPVSLGDGSVRTISWTANKMLGATGEVTGIVALGQERD